MVTGRGPHWAAVVDEIARQRAELDDAQRVLADLTARAVSADKLISVTVDARGKLTDLTIEPAALRRHRAPVLAQLITDLVDDADARLRARRAQVLTALSAVAPGYDVLVEEP
ncbi:YbaB/EbfC family nucleoid-associated protein [Gordonia sp. NPDC003376]